jgi:MGT family glycosyltransferase
MLTTQRAELNVLREGLGLPAVDRISDVHDRCDASVVTNPREFEPALPLPANVCFAGPILEGPALMKGEDDMTLADDGRPLIVVSFSTSQQGQLATLRRILEALAAFDAQIVVTTGPAIDPAALTGGANTTIVRFADHHRLLARASLVVTHAGLGTVMSALAHGVPLLCVPLGRDQFFNASRVEALGAGRTIRMDAGVATIAEGVRTLLATPEARVAARRMCEVIGGYGNGAAAIATVERVAAKAGEPASA